MEKAQGKSNEKTLGKSQEKTQDKSQEKVQAKTQEKGQVLKELKLKNKDVEEIKEEYENTTTH